MQSFPYLQNLTNRSTMFTMEIALLIERCKQGDADALGELYKAYAQRMKSVCRRYISDEQTVEDVLHDAFLIIFTSFDRLRDTSKAESWIISITRNVASKYKDYLDAKPTVPLDEATTIPVSEEEKNVRDISLDEVMRTIDSLPEGYANIFRLSVFEGLSHKEIAEKLGIKPHSSSSQLTRAKRMLQKSLAHHWMLWLLPILFPMVLYLFTRTKPTERLLVTKDERQSPIKEVTTHTELDKANTSAKKMTIIPIRHHINDSVNMVNKQQQTANSKKDTDTIFTERTTPEVRLVDADVQITGIIGTCPNLQHVIPAKRKSSWGTMLAYAGIPSNGISGIDNFLTVIDYASSNQTRSMRIYNWGEYIDYVNNYASEMDSVSAMNMKRIAVMNAGHPNAPISERKHHERPRTFELSLSYPISKHWNLTTGLSYTRMKSTFESDGHNMLTRRTQKLYYVGLPLKLTYTFMEKNRWQFYASGGLNLDIPVRGKETTQHLYVAPNQHTALGDSLILPQSHANVKAPWQWSVHVSAGVQYQLLPHINAYFEPRLQYYIPTNRPIETYHTEHPFDLSLPFGIRFTW